MVKEGVVDSSTNPLCARPRKIRLPQSYVVSPGGQLQLFDECAGEPGSGMGTVCMSELAMSVFQAVEPEWGH